MLIWHETSLAPLAMSLPQMEAADHEPGTDFVSLLTLNHDRLLPSSTPKPLDLAH